MKKSRWAARLSTNEHYAYKGELDDVFERNFATHKTDRVWVAPFYVALSIVLGLAAFALGVHYCRDDDVSL